MPMIDHEIVQLSTNRVGTTAAMTTRTISNASRRLYGSVIRPVLSWSALFVGFVTLCAAVSDAAPRVSVPVRVYLYAGAAATPEEVRDRQQSVDDLRLALAAARNIALVDTEVQSNVAVAVSERAIGHPKVGIKLFPPNVNGPTAVVQLRLRLTYEGKSYDVAPRRWRKELDEGWTAAARDAARLVEQWIARHVRASARPR